MYGVRRLPCIPCVQCTHLCSVYCAPCRYSFMDVFFRSNDGGGGQRRSTVPADGRRYLSTVALEDRVHGWSTHHHLRGILWAREFVE